MSSSRSSSRRSGRINDPFGESWSADQRADGSMLHHLARNREDAEPVSACAGKEAVARTVFVGKCAVKVVITGSAHVGSCIRT